MSIEHLHSVPHLTTALTGPLLQIESHLLSQQADIEAWFRQQWLNTPAPFYASVDLRNAGFKLAPVDTNLFPAGFNNLNPDFLPLCIQAVQLAIEHACPKARKVLLIPESHTRNQFYFESIATLQEILIKAGFEVRIGSLIQELEQPKDFPLPSGRSIKLEPLIRENNKVGVPGFFPCMVLLNNDLSGGRPDILENLDNQMVMPPIELGWTNRLKSSHFNYYREITEEFAKLIDIDPWLITPLFRNCGEIDFKKREGEDCLARNADALLKAIRDKYKEHGLDAKPFVIVKADAGTYGMGIMTVHSGEEIYDLNRKQRTKMSASKAGQNVSQVIIQEGVYTFETWGPEQAVAEPVIYMMDRFVVGGFYRVHTGRGANENLNAPGMHFEPLAFVESCNTPDLRKSPDANPNRFYAYGVIARLALLAAARELAEQKSKNT